MKGVNKGGKLRRLRVVVASDHQSGARSGHRSQTATRSWGGRGSTDQGRPWGLQSEKNMCIAASALEKETSEAREAGREWLPSSSQVNQGKATQAGEP